MADNSEKLIAWFRTLNKYSNAPNSEEAKDWIAFLPQMVSGIVWIVSQMDKAEAEKVHEQMEAIAYEIDETQGSDLTA